MLWNQKPPTQNTFAWRAKKKKLRNRKLGSDDILEHFLSSIMTKASEKGPRCHANSMGMDSCMTEDNSSRDSICNLGDNGSVMGR